MKDATGELSMTVIAVVAIAAVAAFFYAFIWPGIKVSILNNQCEAQCGDGNFTPITREMVQKAEGGETDVCSCSGPRYNNFNTLNHDEKSTKNR